MDPTVFTISMPAATAGIGVKVPALSKAAIGDRLVLPGCARTPETVEAFVHGWLDGRRAGIQWGNAEGAESVRRDLRNLLGVPANPD